MQAMMIMNNVISTTYLHYHAFFALYSFVLFVVGRDPRIFQSISLFFDLRLTLTIGHCLVGCTNCLHLLHLSTFDLTDLVVLSFSLLCFVLLSSFPIRIKLVTFDSCCFVLPSSLIARWLFCFRFLPFLPVELFL